METRDALLELRRDLGLGRLSMEEKGGGDEDDERAKGPL